VDKPVTYCVINGVPIFEGDIALGPPQLLDMPALGSSDQLPVRGVGITGAQYRWPAGILPWQTQPVLRTRVVAAIDHWQANTSIRFVERTAANAAQYPDYVSFEERDGCWSYVGKQGGLQVIALAARCVPGTVVHMIGHAVGLWHEHSREDRDTFIRIQYENITPGMEHNFDQHITDGDDVGPYDFGSIMHYGPTAFSSNGLPTIVPLGGQPIGQRTGLSEGDIAAVQEMYSRRTPIESQKNDAEDSSHTGGRAQRHLHQADSRGGVDDTFWVAHSERMITNAIPAHDNAADTLQKTLAWFWTAYSAAVAVGVALARKQYPLWLAVLLALPGPILVLAYLLSAYARMPRIVRFDPRDPGQIRDEHQRVLKYKRRTLQLALWSTFLSALLVALAIAAASLFGDAKQPSSKLEVTPVPEPATLASVFDAAASLGR
jgi:hypothetical protein